MNKTSKPTPPIATQLCDLATCMHACNEFACAWITGNLLCTKLVVYITASCGIVRVKKINI